MQRVSTHTCRAFVEQRRAFQNHSGSLRGYWHEYEDGSRVYVVWTYNEPLYAYDEEAGQWFGNETKYSRTSSKHKGCAQPHSTRIEWRDKSTMTEIANNGVAGAVRREVKEAA